MTLKTDSGSEFKVNGQRLKHYLGGNINEEYFHILKRGENFAERKTICSNFLAKNIKMSSFLGDNPSNF